jgi:precorrin-6Y C5,15-methyltransferase (decarboxylating)
MSTVTVVGIGLGPDDLSESHRLAIQRAEVLVGGKRQLAMFAGQAEATWTLGANLRATLEEVKKEAAEKRVVILASGDPLFFGIGQRALEVFGPENITFLPNITALQKTFARLKLPWNQAGSVSVHGRKVTDFFAEFGHSGPLAIYTDHENTPNLLARILREYGMANRRVAVVEDIGSEQERCVETDLTAAEGMEFSPLNVMVLYPEEELRPAVKIGLEDGLFAKEKSLITKRESRALILAELQIEPKGVMWDVGAGSGSVGIEAVRVARGLRVYAVERDAARLEMIQDNVKRLGGFGVRAVLGEAPRILDDLPDPDRVFVGGSSGNLTDILEIIEKRLLPGGKAVVSVVTPETLARAQRFVDETELAHEWLLVQIGRTVPIQSEKDVRLSRFQPQTPLFLLSLWRT